MCLSGGVDTCKMEIHRLALALALLGGFLVAAIDMPGTGESSVALAADSEEIYLGVLNQLKKEAGTRCKTGVVGVSFGGHWSAKLALLEAVDAAVDVGGPVGASPLDAKFVLGLPNGMPGILANALRLESMPSGEECETMLAEFAPPMRRLLSRKTTAPLLVLNGADDQYIPRAESLVFSEFSNAEVWLFENATHCAAEVLPQIVPSLVAWLREKLWGRSIGNGLWRATARMMLPPRA